MRPRDNGYILPGDLESLIFWTQTPEDRMAWVETLADIRALPEAKPAGRI